MLVLEESLGELDVFEGVLDVFVAKDLHDVKDVFGSVVFNGSFPMSKRVEGYSFQPWILQFLGDAFSLLAVVVSVMVQRMVWMGEDSVGVVSREGLQHAREFCAEMYYSGVAAFLRRYSHGVGF